MYKIKFFIIGCALTCVLASQASQALTPQEAEAAFAGLLTCDGSQKAEKACKKKLYRRSSPPSYRRNL